MNIISLGAGVQSSTMALMASRGEILPMPDCAIFADTGDEPESVYKWLDWLEKQLPFKIHRVFHASGKSLGVASTQVIKSKTGTYYTKYAPPAYIVDKQGKSGLMMRQCTTDFKIVVIQRKIRELRNKTKVDQWIGISLDEVHRIKPSRKKYISNRYPLIDLRMTRNDCLEWMKRNGYPKPPRSACVFCPFHSDSEWKRLKTQEPKEFEKAVEYEKNLQSTMQKVTGFRGTPFLHKSHKPLNEIDFDDATLSLFGNECEGMCGV